MQIEIQTRIRCGHPKSCREPHRCLPGVWTCLQCKTTFGADGKISAGDEYAYRWLPFERVVDLVERKKRERRDREREV